jgi:hypothetical protein
LDHIGFIPQLYAIPWFMTLFTRKFIIKFLLINIDNNI